MNKCIAVLGAGSWGTALAISLARNGHDVRLWSHRADHALDLAEHRCNRRYLPQTTFPEKLHPVHDMAAAMDRADLALVVVPSHAFQETLQKLRPLMPAGCGLAWASKGLSEDAHLLHETALAIFGAGMPLAVVSGPSFAREVAAGLPTALTVASLDAQFASSLAQWLHSPELRAYTSDDMVGVQLGGACKNVLAIAAGVADGLGFGANERAALITRGLTEMLRLAHSMGGRRETMMGLAGMGDLILTCTDNQSRNRRFGLGIGTGRTQEDIRAEIGQEIEGYGAARLVHQLAARQQVEMPISEQTYRILYEGLPPAEAVRNLLLREAKPENS
ncbi:MAG: hypothetical protein RIQ52_288 [Pseudomonadota bacterium]|jgi:glycerol-3-phosphate dehydrogenase (NAD(P)+)